MVVSLYAFRSQLTPRVLALNALITAVFAVVLGAREIWLYLEERGCNKRSHGSEVSSSRRKSSSKSRRSD